MGTDNLSTPRGGETRRAMLLRRLADAGRDLSDAAVMFHTALAERLGLGASDWKTLGLIERHGPLSAGELSARSGLAPPSVTGIIDRLERGGWVHRGRDPGDGRRVVVSLDPKVSADRLAGLFSGLQRRLENLYEQYRDDELELGLEFMQQIAQRQKEATAELMDASPSGDRHR